MSVILGDCVAVMAAMDAASVDAIVTDPPYGLEFMGKEWDRLDGAGFHAPKDEGRTFTNASGHMFDNLKALPRFGSAQKAQAFHARWATEAFRIAKPGAYLLAFGGTRTYHRLACAIEDAGWIIRDCLVWAYASGFPKSRALLKPAWEPIVMARKPGPLRELAIDACRIPTDETYSYPNGPQGTHFTGPTGRRSEPVESSPLGRWPANLILTDDLFSGDTLGVVGGGEVSTRGPVVTGKAYALGDIVPYGGQLPEGAQLTGYGDTGTYSRFFLVPKSDRSEREPVLGIGGEAKSGGRVNVHPT